MREPVNTPIRNDISTRDRAVLAGLYLSRFDEAALRELGFGGFWEAFNTLGFALGVKPASIKNYRDEFDPYFPNARSGWHKRRLRDYCKKLKDEHSEISFELFSGLVRSFFEGGEHVAREEDGGFAQRLITGMAAEQYFCANWSTVPEFQGCVAEDTTRLGCGYDFRLRGGLAGEDFLAVEVKGMREATGSLLFTPKEYSTAEDLQERYFVFVVKNFRDRPNHDVYRDPVGGAMQFRRTERVVVQVAWQVRI